MSDESKPDTDPQRESARRDMRLQVALDLLERGGLTDDYRKEVERAWQTREMIEGLIHMLTAAADAGGARNYVQFVVEGIRLPFDRCRIELMKPGQLSPHERAEECKRLTLELTDRVLASDDVEAIHDLASACRSAILKSERAL